MKCQLCLKKLSFSSIWQFDSYEAIVDDTWILRYYIELALDALIVCWMALKYLIDIDSSHVLFCDWQKYFGGT